MNRLSLIAVAALTFAIGGCGPKEAEVRLRPAPLATSGPTEFRLAEARGHFALGNVALALQGFRMALRESPGNVDALNGLAAGYDRMGRFDLSRRYYEEALAIAPGDARLYANLATSLDLQGRTAEAAKVRADFAARMRGERLASVPDASPSPPPALAAAPDATAATAAGSVTVALAPAPAPQSIASDGPALERLSLAEVALVTRPRPQWRTTTVARTANATTISFTPVTPRVTLLNGARVEGLAARTRAMLEARGWRRIAIGDAPRVTRRSVVAYPAGRRAEAVRLANQFDFALRHDPGGEQQLTLVLGRDAIGVVRSRTAG